MPQRPRVPGGVVACTTLEAASLVEILMAVSLMAITAIGVFQIMAFTETQLIQSRNDLGIRKGEEQALSYVYDDFLEAQLTDSLTPALFDNDSVVAQDLRIATVLGTQSRYQTGLSTAKCTTTVMTNETVGTVSFDSDCVETPDDVFVTDSDGFFSTVNDNPRDVSFNYGFAAANDEAFAREREAVRTRLGINQVFRNEALCRHGHDVSFLTPPSCSDNLTVAYAWIDSGYDNTSDSLVIVGSTGAEDGVETVYSDIPFVDNMTARWDPRTGVMTFRRTDNGTVQNEQWELAMNSVGFKPNSDNYRTNKLLKFSIGRLSFEIDGIDHFYNFFPERPSTWDDALAAASADNNSFCGIPGYLATVTSAEENAFLAERFINADGTWPKGYLGGYDNDSDDDVHHWMWAAPSP
ncbi:MAG: hypothetical protein VXY13_06360, partial [Pseudomonadota bacterium]|nr:hypothetical protein [Pseudomonadota bacterium]